MNIAAPRLNPHGMTISFMNRTADPLTKPDPARVDEVRSVQRESIDSDASPDGTHAAMAFAGCACRDQ